MIGAHEGGAYENIKNSSNSLFGVRHYADSRSIPNKGGREFDRIAAFLCYRQSPHREMIDYWRGFWNSDYNRPEQLCKTECIS